MVMENVRVAVFAKGEKLRKRCCWCDLVGEERMEKIQGGQWILIVVLQPLI